MYVGRDGNLYRRDESGDWDKLNKGGWSGVDRPQTTQVQPHKGTRDLTRAARPSTGQVPRPTTRPTA